MASKRRWQDLSPAVRTAVVVAAVVQFTLLGIAHADLTRRSADEVRGPKRMWRLITLVNFIGPIAYFVAGREKSAT